MVKEQIISILNFKMGHLPVEYLGLPLVLTRLKKENCHVLIDSIFARVLNWAAKSLSYVGDFN